MDCGKYCFFYLASVIQNFLVNQYSQLVCVAVYIKYFSILQIIISPCFISFSISTLRAANKFDRLKGMETNR